MTDASVSALPMRTGIRAYGMSFLGVYLLPHTVRYGSGAHATANDANFASAIELYSDKARGIKCR